MVSLLQVEKILPYLFQVPTSKFCPMMNDSTSSSMWTHPFHWETISADSEFSWCYHLLPLLNEWKCEILVLGWNKLWTKETIAPLLQFVQHLATCEHKQRLLYHIITNNGKCCLYFNTKQHKEWPSCDKQATLSQVKAATTQNNNQCLMCLGRTNLQQNTGLQPYNQHRALPSKNALIHWLNEITWLVTQNDITYPNIANLTKNATQEFGWEVLMHYPYSLDIELSDYQLSWSHSNSLWGIFIQQHGSENMASGILHITTRDSYNQSIDKLVECWQEVVNNEKEYIIVWFTKIVDKD